MNQWSSRRKLLFFVATVFVVIIFVGVPGYFFLYQAPTCTDSKMNGDETGVDCGGSCRMLCKAESLPIIALGDPQILEIFPGIFEVVGIFENPNVTAEVERAKYSLKIYNNKDSVPIKVIEGEVYVPAGSRFAIFEEPFEIDEESDVSKVFLEWHSETLVWQKTELLPVLPEIENMALLNEESSPRLTASLRNTSLSPIRNVEAVAVVYNSEGNTSATSRTFVENIGPSQVEPLVFTWPFPFIQGEDAQGNFTAEIILRSLPDQSSIR